MKLSFGQRIARTYTYSTIGAIAGWVLSYFIFDKTVESVIDGIFIYFAYITSFAVALYCSPRGELE
jgi:competence CoiA-like predicted nuclease